MKAIELLKKLTAKHKSYELLCDELKAEIIKNLDFNWDDEEEMQSYISDLTLQYQQSDGFVIVDQDGGNFSVNMLLNALKNEGNISYENFQLCQI